MKHTSSQLKMSIIACMSALLAAGWALVQTHSVPNDAPMVFENRSGVKWELQRTPAGWVLGTLLLHGKPVEQATTKDLLVMRNVKSGEVRWLAASQGGKIDALTATMSGRQEIDGANLSNSRVGSSAAHDSPE